MPRFADLNPAASRPGREALWKMWGGTASALLKELNVDVFSDKYDFVNNGEHGSVEVQRPFVGLRRSWDEGIYVYPSSKMPGHLCIIATSPDGHRFRFVTDLPENLEQDLRSLVRYHLGQR